MNAQDHPLYRTWTTMRHRCRNPKATSYALYGGRGVAVCERWNDFWSFVADMGDRPPGHSLDRIDVNGNYEPTNCRWANPIEQGRNRRNNELISIGGVEYKLVDLAALAGKNKKTIRQRVKAGLPYELVIDRANHKSGSPDIMKAVAARIAKQRAATHCKRGHEYTERDWNGGKRLCRECQRMRGSARSISKPQRPWN